ncbi:MAG: ribonuclease HII [Clostridia bacterium]|nr:ribonuclease HII [Clostridia bacterium]
MTRMEQELQRLRQLTQIDRTYWDTPGSILAGMDEVGRGPLAGPVVIGCVVMPQEPLLLYINDSKKVTKKRRALLYEQIQQTALAFSTAWISPEVIDQINILEATKLGFAQAFGEIALPVTDVLIDALSGLDIPARQHPLIHGDALSYSIGAASILAKEARDRYMMEQDALYPQYGFAKNKGYGTAQHMEALKKYGPCPIHRRSFIGHFCHE